FPLRSAIFTFPTLFRSGRAGDHVHGVTICALEVAAAQPAVVLQMPDHRLYGLSSPHPRALPPRQRLRFATVQDVDAFDLPAAIEIGEHTSELHSRENLV